MTKLMKIEEIMLCNLVLLRIPNQPRNWRSFPGGRQNLLVHSLWRGKSLFSYINPQVTEPVRGAKPCKIFHLRGIGTVHPTKYVPSMKALLL